MPLTPQDVVRKEFREAFRGYNQAEVDLFLDEVVEEFQRIADENSKMKVRIAALQQEVARLREGAGGTVAGGGDDPKKVEEEVRSRVRRFLEEQIRLLDASAKAKRSPTVERIAAELPESPAPAKESEPFWAGE